MRHPYNKSGYDYDESIFNATETCRQMESNDDTSCGSYDILLHDRIDGKAYVAGDYRYPEWISCLRNLMSTLRYRTEQHFEETLNLVDNISCEPFEPTGSINCTQFSSAMRFIQLKQSF